MILRATQQTEYINEIGQADIFGKAIIVLRDDNGKQVSQARARKEQPTNSRPEKQKHTARLLKERQQLTDQKYNASLLKRQQIRLNLINIQTELNIK